MDKRIVAIISGFALQSALNSDRSVDELASLYSNPDLATARRLYDRLVNSSCHSDREISIWLQQCIEQDSSRSDPKKLVADLKEMEFLLYVMLNRAGDAQNSVNDWLNYVVNAAESFADVFWIDGKILLSRALEVSQSESMERLKLDRSLAFEIDVLQRATMSCFREALTYPSKIAIPDGTIENILKVQAILLGILQFRHKRQGKIDEELFDTIAARLNAAIRDLMRGEKEAAAASQEMTLAVQYMNEKKDRISDHGTRKLIQESSSKIKELLQIQPLSALR